MKKSWEQIHQELSEPFSHEDVEWKIQTVSKDKSRGLAVAYVTARAIQNRLDAVVGAQNWKPVFRQWHTVTDRDGNPLPIMPIGAMRYKSGMRNNPCHNVKTIAVSFALPEACKKLEQII